MPENTKMEFDRHFEHVWWLISPSVEPTAEGREKVFELVNELFDAFGHLLVPERVSYMVQEASTPSPIINRNRNGIKTLSKHVQLDTTTTSTQQVKTIRRDIESSTTHDYWIPTKLTVSETPIRIAFPDGDHHIFPANENFVGDTYESFPTNPPLTLRFFNNYHQNAEARVGLEIDVSCTPIWFDSTPTGQANRTRLATALHQLVDELPITEVEIDSTKWTEDAIEMYFPELVLEPTHSKEEN